MNVFRWLKLVSGILFLLVGFSMFSTPAENLVALSLILCVTPIVNGILAIIGYFSTSKIYRSTLQIVYGILTILLGIWLLSSGGVIAVITMLPFIFALWVIVSSVITAVESIELKQWGVKDWVVSLILGIIGFLLGLAMIFDPIRSAITLSLSLAIMLVYRGIVDIVMFFAIRKMKK